MVASFLDNLSPGGFQLLNFAALAAAMLFAVTVAWLYASYHRKKRKRKRRHQGHDRINPTRAELGGLPPPRNKSERGNRSDPPSSVDL
jgi:hypothetical protein